MPDVPDILLVPINPQDTSYPFESRYPAGGFLGDGDLTTNDGDTSGFEAYNSTSAAPDDPGQDQFRYDIDCTPLPPDIAITGYRFEITSRLVSASPQGYARPGMSVLGVFWYRFYSGFSGDLFAYSTAVSDTWLPSDAFREALRSNTVTASFAAEARNTNSEDLGSVRVTMAGLRIYYQPAASVAPPCRQWGRDDGMAAGSARRQYPQPSSHQRSNRRAGGYF